MRFDRVDAANFVAGVRERLPRYQAWFQEAAAVTGIDWRLLAAIGYQESRWDEAAVSPTGVQGVMMLTAETARRVGVADRNDPRDSILGGARYLRVVEKTIPARIPEPDRTWLTLAAYNVGYGHLEDARILTQRRGQDPDSWPDVRANLPLLAQERYYSTLAARLCARLGAGRLRPQRPDLRRVAALDGSPTRRRQRRPAKKPRSSAPHSSDSTPPKLSTWWFIASEAVRLKTLPAAPWRGSQAPNTSRAMRACAMAAAHIGQGSSVT